MWSVCGVMHLITTSEAESVDERIHTLADRRMVISLMNGAFDQDLNGLLCWFSCVCINSAPFETHNVLIIHREMHLRFASECRREWHNVRHWLFARLTWASQKALMMSFTLPNSWNFKWLSPHRVHQIWLRFMRSRTEGKPPCRSWKEAQHWWANANKLWDKITGFVLFEVAAVFSAKSPLRKTFLIWWTSWFKWNPNKIKKKEKL